VQRGECDLAGSHSLDPATDTYNIRFLPAGARLVRGDGRMQGIAYRQGDRRFEGLASAEIVERVSRDRDCHLVNRNRGSGTRISIDRLLAGRRPRGDAVEARSHNAVSAALQHARADWGVLIASVAVEYGLAFVPLSEQRFDFIIP
jgi:putative molybdopterin biosynthesis protein